MYYDSATTASPSNGRNPFGERVEKASKRHCLCSVDFFALMCSVVLIRYLVLLEACGDAVCCPVQGRFPGSLAAANYQRISGIISRGSCPVGGKSLPLRRFLGADRAFGV